MLEVQSKKTTTKEGAYILLLTFYKLIFIANVDIEK